MEQVLLVVHVIIAAALIGIVLLQRSETDGFGLGSGSGSNLLSGRSAANLLTRTTGILAALFIINSLVLSALSAHNRAPSLVDAIEKEQTQTAPAVPLAGSTTDEKNTTDNAELAKKSVVKSKVKLPKLKAEDTSESPKSDKSE